MAFNKKEYMKKWRAEHRKHINEYAKKYREEHLDMDTLSKHEYYKKKKEFILSYNIRWLMDHWYYRDGKFYCPECGEEIDVTQVHNHHIEPESKLFNISQWRKYSIEMLEAELAKTKPICPQCHKLITARERNHWVFRELNTLTNAELIVKFAEHVPHFERRR